MTLILSILVLCGVANSAVLQVPSSYSTIQAALDATNPLDTVLVAPGRYHEFLVGPLHSYALIGLLPPDSVAGEQWTVLDPIPLPDADTPSTFVARGDTVLVKNIAFFNRFDMRQPEFATRAGGIRGQCVLLAVEDCRFDSVSQAIDRVSRMRVSRTGFRGGSHACIFTAQGGNLAAERCFFDGTSGYSYILAGDGSTIDSCIFGCNPAGHFVGLFGSHLRLRDCTFGPCDGNLSTVFIYPVEDVIIERCDFVGVTGVSQILEIDAECADPLTPPIYVRNNTFRAYEVGNYALKFWCAEDSGYIGLAEDNSFVEGLATAIPGSAINVSGSASISGNTFENVEPSATADVHAHAIMTSGTLVARNNHFLPPGLAASTAGAVFDARWNWWGDSTGPYEGTLNPEGQGTPVQFGVEFVPWLVSPEDSLIDTNEVAVEIPLLATPQSYRVNTYPNPFNASVTLMMEVALPGIYALKLYDVTGREVAQVYRGMIRERMELRYTNIELASGVYFARLSGSTGELATAKLLLLK